MGLHESGERSENRAAYEIIAAHVLDPAGLCRVCQVPGPCRPANAAANRLVELGLPVCPAAVPESRLAALRRWRAWARPCIPTGRKNWLES
ncbi:hypothetical protein [Micromonospora rubida]|uniref:hypothetical protein n=1 Tax=Micromonospora rubida TaxID=2697657 RepID=UPI0013790A9C|nr:hypothetical protein [Micromonospora rubida]NBE82316.1 hypothetical protein [Micromonospora rubida]